MFKAQVELKTDFKIKTLQCDGGGEFQASVPLLNHTGITMQLSCPHTAE